MRADRESLLALLALYLEEFAESPDGGFDRNTFVDWCASGVLAGDMNYSSGTSGLIEFYQNRIAALRALWASEVVLLPSSGCCRAVVTDNFGELVEVWDCAPGEERIDLAPSGRARSFEVPTSFRPERFSWTDDGRALILRLRELQRKGAVKDEARSSARKDASRKTPRR